MILEHRSVRAAVIGVMLVAASLFNLIPTPAGMDSGWLFVVPVAVSAIAAGVREGLLVALIASAVCAVFAGAEAGAFDRQLAFTYLTARFALYGITAVVLGAFAEAHYSGLRDLATLDPLTKVFNIASFYKQIGALEGQPHAYAVMLVDLDDLKKINDAYGHQAGSEAIQSVANVLRRVVRGSDSIARFGGDEFVAILRDADVTGARLVVDRLREMLRDEILPAAPELKLSVSCGVALFGEDGKSSAELLEAADKRMYRDKQSRKLAAGRAARSDPSLQGFSPTS